MDDLPIASRISIHSDLAHVLRICKLSTGIKRRLDDKAVRKFIGSVTWSVTWSVTARENLCISRLRPQFGG